MEQVTQLANKMIAERARNISNITPPTEAPEIDPPPYAASEASDSDDEDDNEPATRPLKLTINAAHSIHGSNNLVPTPPTPLADATKFSTLLLHAVNQINNAVAASPRRPLRVDLTINCGITVIGDRNVVGAVGLRPKSVPEIPTAVAPPACVGAKRKAETVSSVS